MLKRVSFYWQL